MGNPCATNDALRYNGDERLGDTCILPGVHKIHGNMRQAGVLGCNCFLVMYEYTKSVQGLAGSKCRCQRKSTCQATKIRAWKLVSFVVRRPLPSAHPAWAPPHRASSEGICTQPALPPLGSFQGEVEANAPPP